MKVAVVIPTLEEADQVEAAIQTARAPDVEIAVVDGGSRDATCERARRAGALVIESEPGRARQLARGVDATSAPVLLFLHADTRLPAGWSEQVREVLAAPGVVGGAFRFGFDARELRQAPVRLAFVQWGARLRGRLFALPYGDQALFARREALAAIGGVPAVPVMEDLELVQRLKRAGQVVLLRSVAATSARRYLRGGVFTTMLRHWAAALAFWLGLDRERVAAWLRR